MIAAEATPLRDLRGVQCLVTGATGFIGRRLVQRMCDEGAHVRGVARSQAPTGAHELVLVDLAALERDAALLDNIELVFHLAAKTHDLHENAAAEHEYRRANVEGTTRLLRLERAGRLRRVVMVSSVKAVDEGNDRPADESTSPAPLTPYGRTKLEAERVLFTQAASRGFEAVCLRFPLVYGPGQPGNLQRMIRAIERRRFPPPPRRGNLRSMLHVDNAVDALLLAARHPAAAGQTYFVTDARPYATREIYDAARNALGLRASGTALPRTMFRLLAWGGDVIKAITGRSPGFGSDQMQKLLGTAVYRIDKIQREVGYAPSRDLLATLPAIVSETRRDRS